MTQDLDALPLPEPDGYAGRDYYHRSSGMFTVPVTENARFTEQQIRAAHREGYELAMRKAQEGREPVAWRVRRSDGEHELFFHEPTAKQRAECFVPHSSAEPLYTSPPPKSDEARDAEREPEGWFDVPKEHAARDAFEAQNKCSHGFKRSARGTYVNPPVARDWKWFQLGIEYALKEQA